MGVKYLNRLIRKACVNVLKKTPLSELQDKKIAVDISIYMYKYKQNGDLIDGIFNMINIFQKYNIEPIFIFDGKPPVEKEKLLNDRYIKKQTAKTEYNKLMIKYNELNKNINTRDNYNGNNNNCNYNNNNCNCNNYDLIKLEKELDYYKRNMTKLTYKDITDVKKLIHYMGENYYESHMEADSIIAKLVNEEKVWGCMSEDMDMFVYGCPFVLRYFSLIKEEVIIYDLYEILKRLNLTHEEFKEICILSGTDYNSNNIEFNINFIMKKYIQYSKTNKNISFYEWFSSQNYVIDINKLNQISELFNIKYVDLSKSNYVKGNKNHKKVVELLINYGYIFI